MDNLSQELQPIRLQLLEVSPVDLSSVDCVEKLQSVLSECQQALQSNRDEENVLQLLKYGLEKLLLESLQAFCDQSDSVDESNESLFDIVLETINVLAECGVKACELIVPNICVELLDMLTYKVFNFQQKMEILKSVNVLLEYSTFIVKEKLLLKQSFIDTLKKLFNQILYIGDYEFQVGALECLFRLIPRKVRNMIGQKIIVDPRQLATFLIIQDSNFETDCRTFLNNLNSSLGERKRVMSIPCISVQLGSRPLQKPSDTGYTEFWVDFNYGSQRITIFCEQDSTMLASQATQEEDLWETISILSTDVESYNFSDSNRCVTGVFNLTANITDIFSQMRNIEGNQLIILSDQAYNMPQAVRKTFTQQSVKKVSSVCEPIVVRTSGLTKNDMKDIEMVPSSQMSVTSSVVSSTPRRVKVSVPFIPMSTPASSVIVSEKFGSRKENIKIQPRIEKVKASVALAEINLGSSKKKEGFQAPSTPVNNKQQTTKRRVKTPVVVLEPDKRFKDQSKQNYNDIDSNKENRDPRAFEEDMVIPDSLPSQSVYNVEKKRSSHKLREVDSGICLLEPDQQNDKQHEVDHGSRAKKCSTAILNSQKPRSRQPLITVAEASKICVESDENISDLSSEIISIREDNMEEHVKEVPDQQKKSPPAKKAQCRILSQKQHSNKKPNKPKSSMPAKPKRNVPERCPPPILESEETNLKYGKGKGHSLYTFDKPLCATPVLEKPPLRYSLVSSRSKERIDSIASVLGIEKQKDNSRNLDTSRDITSQKTLTPLIGNKKSQKISEETTCDNNFSSLENEQKGKISKKPNNKNVLDIHEKPAKELCKSVALPNQTEQSSKTAEESTSIIPKTKDKKSRKKGGNKSEIIQDTSTRNLRRRKQEENKTVEETITMVQSTSAEDFTGTYTSPKKSHGNNGFSHTATLSSSKKAFFFETRTTVTNSYRNSTPTGTAEKSKKTSVSDDPYTFEDFEDDADDCPKTVKQPAKNKFFKSRNKGKNVVGSKSESCVNSKKTKSKQPSKQNKSHQSAYSGFSDEDDNISVATERSKLSVAGSRSLPNLSAVPMEPKSIHPSRQAKTVKSYYIPSEDEIDPEEEPVTPEEPKKTKGKTIPTWKQATLDKIKDIRDSNKFSIFNRESWSTGKSAEKTPKFDLNISKYPLETPHTDKERVKDRGINTSKSDSVIEKFTAICTGLLLDSKDTEGETNSKQKDKRSKTADSVPSRSKPKYLESSTGKDAQSEISWLEKKSSGKRKKFKKTYQVERERRRNKRYRNEDSESSSEEEEELSEEEQQKLVTNSRISRVEIKTPKIPISSSTTPRGMTPSYKKQRSPLDIRLGLTPKTPHTPADSTGLPSLCVVSEDAATAPNSVQRRKKLQESRKLESEESETIEDANVPVSIAPSQNISEPTFSQITSLNELMKMATPKHIKKILDGDDDNSEEQQIVEKVERKNKKSPKSKHIEKKVESLTASNEDPEASDDSTEEQNFSQAGLVSGPSSRVRPTKSALKRKYCGINESSNDEGREGSTSDEISNEEHDDSSFIPRKLFRSAQKEKEEERLSAKSLSRSNVLLQKRPNNKNKVVRTSSDVRSISTEATDASLENDLNNLEEEEVSLKTGVTAVVRTFGVDIQNQLKAKRKQLETITHEAVKNSQKMASKMWSKQHSRRNKVLEKYEEKILNELESLEKEIVMLKEEEDKTLNFFTHQMKLLKNYRDSQQKRVQNMSHCQEELVEELNKADEETHHYQQNFKTTLKKDMSTLQQRLLKETQQHQLMNVRKCLQTLYL